MPVGPPGKCPLGPYVKTAPALHPNVVNCENTLTVHTLRRRIFLQDILLMRAQHPSSTACKRTVNFQGLAQQKRKLLAIAACTIILPCGKETLVDTMLKVPVITNNHEETILKGYFSCIMISSSGCLNLQ